MRALLQRLLVRPIALQILHAGVELSGNPCALPARSISESGSIGNLIVGRRLKSDLALNVRDESSYTGSPPPYTSGTEHSDEATKIKQEVDGADKWKSQLTTIEEYEHESNLGEVSDQGPRLVDDCSYGANLELWVQLILFRRHLKDTIGENTIWKELRKRNLQLPTEGCKADRLWDQVVQSGDWKNVVAHAQWIRATTGKTWHSLYFKIVGQCLSKIPRSAYRWHSSLLEEFAPSSGQLKQLFSQVVANPRAMAALKAIYKDLPVRDMYTTIIPQLCSLGQYGLAVKWHKFMMEMNDRPPTSITAEPLLHYLAVQGKINQLAELIKGLDLVGISFLGPDSQSFKPKDLIPYKTKNSELGEIGGVGPELVSDQFFARLFATTAFSIDAIINGLRFLGTSTIGPLALRELASREGPLPNLCRQRIDQLKAAGISIGESTFSTLVASLASKDEGELLREVINCDMHPDTFENQELQRSLLKTYQQKGDRLREDRSIAILTVKMPPKIQWNVLLSSSLKRQDTARTYQILESMQEHGLSVSALTSTYVRRHLLCGRQRSHRPKQIKDVQNVLAIYQRILRAGGEVQPLEWREILRRLGMMGQLAEIERVAIWLADWYSNPTAQASQRSLFNLKGGHAPKNTFPLHEWHPLRQIFPPPQQEAFVTWGFQYASNTKQAVPSCGDDGPTWRWGLQLLRKLSQRKVPVRRDSVRKACLLRLLVYFGQGRSKLRINRRAQRRNRHSLEYYAKELEELCGPDFFCVDPSLPRDDPGRKLNLRDWMTNRKPRRYRGKKDCSGS